MHKKKSMNDQPEEALLVNGILINLGRKKTPNLSNLNVHTCIYINVVLVEIIKKGKKEF